MKLLAIDTSTEACSAALLDDDDIIYRYEVAPRQHAGMILAMCESLLDEAGVALPQLDALAFGRGPGAFTGVRIATGVIQGIAFAHDLPVVPVSSLAALAYGQWREHQASQVMAAFDARINEVYWACYRCSAQGVEAVCPEQVCLPAAVQLPTEGRWLGAGSGWASYGEMLGATTAAVLEAVNAECFPHARDTVALAALAMARGETVAAAQAIPVYLRDKVAEKKQRKD